MDLRVATGFSSDADPVEAFREASRGAALGLASPCDLAVVFVGASHVGEASELLAAIHEQLAPANLIGCGAAGVVAARREIEDGPGAVVWALAAPEAEIASYHLFAEREEEELALLGLPDPAAADETLIVLADPYTYPTEALLECLNDERPGVAVLGGLASAAPHGSACLLIDDEVVDSGAVGCSISGITILPCVSQGAEPVGAEMTITACEGNVISELASQPAVERLRAAVGELDERERELLGSGMLLGIVIDENQPDYLRGDFLVRPIIGAAESSGSVAVGEQVRVGQTVRMHVRDPACADEDLRAALALQAAALESSGAAGALLFTCNGRGRGMFGAPDHDAGAVDDALAVPTAGFFCAGEIGPVGGRNFLHGFTATIAVFAP